MLAFSNRITARSNKMTTKDMINDYLNKNEPTLCDDYSEDEIWKRDKLDIGKRGRIYGRKETNRFKINKAKHKVLRQLSYKQLLD